MNSPTHALAIRWRSAFRVGFHRARRAGVRTAVLALALAVSTPVMAPVAAQPVAGASLVTTPDPPRAGQPFTAVFTLMASPGTVGFWTNPPPIAVDGNTIVVPFDVGCGFLCPPGMVLRSFQFPMPALAAGTYDVVFGSTTSPVARFDLAVVSGAPAAAIAAPGPGSALLLVLASTLLLLARRRLPPPASPST
jgi:hypothetical protein